MVQAGIRLARNHTTSNRNRGTGKMPGQRGNRTAEGRNRGTGRTPQHRSRTSGLRPERGDHRGTPPHSRQGSPEVPPHPLLTPPGPPKAPLRGAQPDPHDRSNQADEEQHQHTPETETEARRHPAWKSQWHSTEALGPGDQAAGNQPHPVTSDSPGTVTQAYRRVRGAPQTQRCPSYGPATRPKGSA